jgi:hypothetical protein|tara:strand:+ start:244 stop:438 length:195 start_codon:yes stop_codon:yes gene_type:complete
MDNKNLMKMFIHFGQGDEQTLEDKIKYESRIVFTAPGMIKPDNWEELTLEVRRERLKVLKKFLK